MLMNKRKAAIGYATYLVAGNVARRVVRRRARRFVEAIEITRPRRRVLPLVGGAAAAAAVAGAAVAARRYRRNGRPHDD